MPDLHNLPKSTLSIFGILERSNVPMTEGDLIKITSLSPRTVRYSIARLKQRNIITSKANLRDMRSSLYQVITQGVAP